MRKLSLTVSASLLALAGCGGEPVHTNSGPSTDVPTTNVLPGPTDTAVPVIAPNTMPPGGWQPSALPPKPSMNALPTPLGKPGAPPEPDGPTTNAMPPK